MACMEYFGNAREEQTVEKNLSNRIICLYRDEASNLLVRLAYLEGESISKMDLTADSKQFTLSK